MRENSHLTTAVLFCEFLIKLSNCKLILMHFRQVEMTPMSKKYNSAKLQWRFMTISKLWSDKKFCLGVVSEPDHKFNCNNGRYEDMLLNQMFSGSSFPLKMGNYRSCLDKTRALNLKFEVRFSPGCFKIFTKSDSIFIFS